METLVKDVFGLIVGDDPIQARILSMVCKGIRDTMRGLFKLTSRYIHGNPFESCIVYTLAGKNFTTIINLSESNNTIAVRTVDDEATEMLLTCNGGNFYVEKEDRPRPVDPQRLVCVQARGTLFYVFRDELPTILNFAGILIGDVFNLLGYYNNFAGVDIEKCEDDNGEYYCDLQGQLYRVNVKPRKIRGGVMELKLI